MRNFASTCLLAFDLLATATALKVVKMHIAKRTLVSPSVTKRQPNEILNRRQIPATLTNYGVGYYINASIGSTGQVVSLQLDTGSSDMWMFGPQTQCQPQGSCSGGIYDSSQSTTYSLVSSGAFSIQYGTSGSMVTGDIFTDDVGIGDSPVIIQALQMAVATEATNEPLGIMGIGFDTFESAAVQGGQPYPNVPDALVKQGLINTRAYSLYLDDQEAATGSIIFGGFDAAKFSGELSAVPMIPDANGVVDQMLVALTDVQINDPQDGPASIFSTAVPALLDSGTTISFLPTDTFAYLVSFTGAVNDQTYGWILLCSVSTYTGTLDYSFGDQGGPTISVPFSEVIRPLTDPDGNPITDSSGNEYCSFGIGPQPDGEPVVLGDTFLRSAYVLYDLDSQLIALGQTLFNSAQSEIVELGASQDGIVVASGSPDGGSAPTVTVSALSVGASGPALTETATQRVGPQTENTDGGSAITVTPTVGAVQTGGLASLRATKTKGVGVTGGSGAGGTTTASALATVTGKGAASPMLSPSGAVWVLLAMGAVFSMVLSFQV